jgi:hypothetical protein
MTGFDKVFSKQNVLWKPHYKQALALKSAAFELLFGGAAGGGKSDFLLIDFWAGVMKYGKNWRGILFRKTYAELEELLKRAGELYVPLGGRFLAKRNEYAFPNGAYIRFKYLENDNDVANYQGHQYTWIGFDELGNYPSDFAWRYMISRCRSAAGVPCYMRATANPGGAGHAWIRARFIDGFEPYKTHRTVETASGGAGVTVSRCFIPSLIEDNPTLMRNDPGYAERLKLLPNHQYRALRKGDWDVFAGQVFDEFRREKHVVKPFPLEPGCWKRFYSLDWGFATPFSLGKWAVNAEGRMVRYGEWYGADLGEFNKGLKMGASAAAEHAWEWAVAEGVTEIVADTACWNRTDDKELSVAEKWEEAGFTMIRANKDRKNGKMMFHQQLITLGEDNKPMMLIFDTCANFIRTIPAMVPSPADPEDVDTKLEDHIYDESRYAVMSEFVHHPADALRRQNGNWNFRKQRGGWDPLADRNAAWDPLEDN